MLLLDPNIDIKYRQQCYPFFPNHSSSVIEWVICKISIVHVLDLWLGARHVLLYISNSLCVLLTPILVKICFVHAFCIKKCKKRTKAEKSSLYWLILLSFLFLLVQWSVLEVISVVTLCWTESSITEVYLLLHLWPLTIKVSKVSTELKICLILAADLCLKIVNSKIKKTIS